MPAWEFPGKTLMNEVQATLAANAITTPHLFGSRHRAAHGDAPRYVWVATRVRDRNPTSSQEVEQPRALFAGQLHLEVDCWGVTEAQAWALVSNLMNAAHESARADLQLEGIEVVAHAEAWNQRGELIRVELSIDAPIPEGYVVPADDGVMQEPTPDTFIPTSIQGEIMSTDSVDADGETLLTTVSEDEG